MVRGRNSAHTSDHPHNSFQVKNVDQFIFNRMFCIVDQGPVMGLEDLQEGRGSTGHRLLRRGLPNTF